MEQPPRPPDVLRKFAIWSFVGGTVGLAIVLAIARQVNHDPTATLTTASFNAAYARWQAQQVTDYAIEIRVTGPQAATYRAIVRDGEAVEATRNGRPLTTRRTFGTWSVPGMFSTISRDVAANEQAQATGKPQPLILRAQFNAEYAYPERYQRIDNGSRRGGDSVAVTWEVIEFQRLESTPVEKPDEGGEIDAQASAK